MFPSHDRGGGADLFIGKSGVNLQLRSLTSTNSLLTIAINGNEIDFTVNESSIVHDNLTGAGSNTHAQIDSHIASTSNPHAVTMTDVSPTTTKGDIIVRTASADVRLGVGADGFALVADSGQTSGLRWSGDLATAFAHTTSTSNPHSTTSTQAALAEGLTVAKGTIYVADGGSITALAVGTDGFVLKADSGQTSGLIWAADDGETNTASNLTASGIEL